MKGIWNILFEFVAFLFLPCVAIAQNVGEWQEPCDGSVAGKSLRQAKLITNIMKYILILFCLAFLSNCFAQERYGQYRIVSIDSTENNYFIFCSNDVRMKTSDYDRPFLIKSDDHCHKIYQCDSSRLFCVLSPRIKGFESNIYIDSIYDFYVSSIVNKTMNEGCEYIGHGDYLFMFPNEYICTSKQILGLLYTQNSDTVDCFSFINSQYSLFDSNMLKIWMNFEKSDLPYYEWLKKQKANALSIHLSRNADTITLFRDENCKFPNIKLNIDDYFDTKILLLYKYKNMSFVQIDDGLNSIYGWIKKKSVIKRDPRLSKNK